MGDTAARRRLEPVRLTDPAWHPRPAHAPRAQQSRRMAPQLFWALVFLLFGVVMAAIVTQSWSAGMSIVTPLVVSALLLMAARSIVMPREGLAGAVAVFLIWGSLYPVMRIEILDATTFSSTAIGAWQDALWGLTAVLIVLAGVPRLSMVTICWYGILVAGGMSALRVVSFEAAVFAFRLTYYPMLYYAAGVVLARSAPTVRILHLGLAAHASISVALGLLLSYAARDYWVNLVISNSAERGWGLSAIAREGGLRMTGTFLDPTAFGLYCSIGTILSVSALLYTDSPLRRRLMMLSSAVCALGALLSLSRGAWVLMLVGFVTLGVLRRQLARFLGIAAVLAVIVSVTVGGRFGLPEVDVILDTWTKTVSEGNEQRQSSWEETMAAVRAQPLGFGLGTVGHVGERFREQSRMNPPEITDGWYLKMLAEGGVPLFIAFLVFQGVAIVSLARRLRAPEAVNVPFLAGVVAVLVGTLVQAVASNTWDLFFVAQVLWLLVGAAQAEKPSPTVLRPRRGAS